MMKVHADLNACSPRDFLQWLHKKLYLMNLGLAITVTTLVLLPRFLTKSFDFSRVWSSFIIFFVVTFLQTFYDNMIVYDVRYEKISWLNTFLFAGVYAVSMVFVSFVIKPNCGYYYIPFSLLISMFVVGKTKIALRPERSSEGFLHVLPKRIAAQRTSIYLFYAILIGGTYGAYSLCHVKFYLAYGGAFFVGMLCEEFFIVTKIYKQKVVLWRGVAEILWAGICTGISVGIIWGLVSYFHLSTKTGYQQATLMSLLVVKLLEPLGSWWLSLRHENKMR